MIKNKLDYKLINLAIVAFIFFLVYQTGSLWIDIVNKFMAIVLPFFIAFALAYALYPLVVLLEKKGVKKGFSVAIVVLLIVGIFALLVGLAVPLLFNQMKTFFDGISTFVNDISTKYDFNLGGLQGSLTQTFNDVLKGLGTYVSNGALNLVGLSLNILTLFIITFSAMIYFLSDFTTIRSFIKKYLKGTSARAYSYFKLLDHEMLLYLSGILKIMGIAFVEYTIAFTIIGHPNALLLGFIAAFANLIPYFGGILNNILALITASVISPALLIRTLITTLVLSQVDGYVINPTVYGKTNKVHPIIVIFSVFAGGILWGVMGIVISLPLAIILISTYKFFKEDISDKLEDIKKR